MGPAVGVMLVVRKVDTAVVPRVAVATSRLEADEGRLRSVAGRMLEQGTRRVGVFAGVEYRGER